MILWILRLFQAFRDLEGERDHTVTVLREELQHITTEKLILQDRLDAMAEDRSRMWSLMEKSIEEMKISYQSHINVQWQKQGFGAPYPDAPQIPHHAVPPANQEPITRRELPSEAQARITSNFYRSMAERLNA